MNEMNTNKGQVVLVGAGCGRGLITLMGLEALRTAQVVVYDDLIDDALLAYVPQDCEKVYVGKRWGCHCKKQEQINRILIDYASRGLRVVRLKGGDSFVFGRGGEEYLALEKEGIPCRLVPGVTSSVAVPENAGIPVTHRGVARSFTVITGHTADDTGENYDALAKLDGTLVFLMGLHDYPKITARLIACGKDPQTPAAVISKGFAPDQKRYDGNLETIASVSEGAATPAILVIGQTADFHMENRLGGPLTGAKVTVTGSGAFADKMKRTLETEGAYVNVLPTLKIVPREGSVPASFEGYGWIVLTSSNGVDIFFDQLAARKKDLRALAGVRFACIGKGTADRLATHGIYADFVPDTYTAADLGEQLGKKIAQEAKASGANADSRVLILRAANGSPELNEGLDRSGIEYTDVKIYDTESLSVRENVTDGYLVFASAGGVRAFFNEDAATAENAASGSEASAAPASRGAVIGGNVRPVCIGHLTAEELKKHYSGAYLTAEDYTAEGLCEAILKDYSK